MSVNKDIMVLNRSRALVIKKKEVSMKKKLFIYGSLVLLFVFLLFLPACDTDTDKIIPIDPPSEAPANLTAVQPLGVLGALELSWDAVPGASKYRVEWSKLTIEGLASGTDINAASRDNFVFTDFANTAETSATSYTIAGLFINTHSLDQKSYKIRVCAGNKGGWSDYSRVLEHKQFSPPIGLLSAVSNNPGTITAVWETDIFGEDLFLTADNGKIMHNKKSRYNFYYHAGSEVAEDTFWYEDGTTGPDTYNLTTFTFTNVPAGTWYVWVGSVVICNYWGDAGPHASLIGDPVQVTVR